MRAWLLAAAALATLAALLFARPHATPGPPMRDFEAYYAAGSLWNAGGQVYSRAIWQAEKPLAGVDPKRREALPFVGPPALLPFFGLVARLPFAAANVAWRLALAAALAALACATLLFAGRRITPASALAIAIAALGFGPLTSALALGQIVLPAFLFAVLAIAWAPAGVLAWAQPNVALTLAPQILTRRGAAACAAGAAVFGAACLAVSGVRGLEHYLTVLHRHELAERFAAIQMTPAAIAYGFGAAPQFAVAVGTIVALAAAVAWFFLVRALPDAKARFCATCAMLPLAMPFFHEQDLLVAFVPAVVYALRADARLWPLAGGGALLIATDWLGLAQRPDGTLQTLLLVGAGGCALVALRDRPEVRMLLVPGAVLALVGAAALFAHAHPAPVWPDAMGPLPRGAGSLGIEALWGAEQRATGLLAQQPVWAALRALCLLGCALTACAIAASSRYPAGSRSPSPAPA